MKPTKVYKMSSPDKRKLARIIDPTRKSMMKALIISADLRSAVTPRKDNPTGPRKNPVTGLIE